MEQLKNLILLFIMLGLISSCKTQKNLPSITTQKLNYTPDSTDAEAYLIKPGDQLLISNLNWLSALFPEPNQMQGNGDKGYTVHVSTSGNISMPEIGRIKVAGLTRMSLADSLSTLYMNIVKDPIFEVEITNLRVKVLGAFNIQGTVSLEKETQSLGEVIAKSGGIKYAEAADKIQIIRGNGKEQKVVEYDFQELGDPRIMNLPVYDNDIVYVPPSKASLRSIRFSRSLILVQPLLIALNLTVLIVNLFR